MTNLNNIQFDGLNTNELYAWELKLEEIKMNCYTEIDLIEDDTIFSEKESFLNIFFARLEKLLSSAIEAASIKEERYLA